MGKVSVIIKSDVYSTQELYKIVERWYDFISGEEKESFTGMGYDHEYNNCRIYVIPSDEDWNT